MCTAVKLSGEDPAKLFKSVGMISAWLLATCSLHNIKSGRF